MILLSHPTGNTFARALLNGLWEAGQLALFATTIAVRGDEDWLNLLPQKIRSEFLRRRFDVPAEKLFTRPGLEMLRLGAGRLGISFLDQHESGVASVDAVYHDLDQAVSERVRKEPGLTGVYCYEDGALQTFRAAKERGLRRNYDLPIAYWETSRRLLEEEAQRWPRWKQTLPGAIDSDAKCDRKRQEIELADTVVCPSRFVLDSIPEQIRASRKCIVAEFGSPERATPPEFKSPREKIRVLFAGSMTQRKGLADVFAAMRTLDRQELELVVMGSPLAPMEFYREEFSEFTYEPTRPHSAVLKLMETCDALLLPSIVEGRALVQQEAMSCGLVLLATANAGGEDLIEEGKTGFLLPIRSPEAIAAKLEWLIENRGQLPDMKRAAFARASALTWQSYAAKILGVLG